MQWFLFCHHVACVVTKKFLLWIGIIFSKLGKRSPNFHWDKSQVSAHENTKKFPAYTFCFLFWRAKFRNWPIRFDKTCIEIFRHWYLF